MKTFQAETHCHTRETGPCGRVSAKYLVEGYLENRYKYLFITDHVHQKVLDAPELRMSPWSERVDRFLSGYRAAKEAAKGTELTVMLGMEVTLYDKSPLDLLVFGETEEWLYDHPEFYRQEFAPFYDMMKQNGFLTFQAHPYRYRGAPIEPVCYDGIEIFNAHPRHVTKNKLAVKYAYEHGLYVIAGSDTHAEEDIARGGVMLPAGIESGADLVQYYRENGSPEIIITFE